MTSPETPTVLVVDDEPLYADAHARLLGGRYDVKTVYSGRAALEAVDDTVDVLLVDRRMAHLSGDDVLEALEQRGLQCRRVVISAIEPTIDALEADIDDYLTKPVSASELIDCIERVLE